MRMSASACSRLVLLGSAAALGCSSSSSDTSTSSSAASGGGVTSGPGSGGAGQGGAASSSGPASTSSTGGGGGAGGSDPGVPYVYVGSDDGSIYVFLLDRQSGSLSPLGSVSTSAYPSFLAAAASKQFVYAVNEPSSKVSSFSIDPMTGLLKQLNTVSSQGNGPAYVSIDHSGKWALVANYGGGTVAVLPIQGDGSLGDAAFTASPGVNPHLIRTDATNQFAYVPCKGSDYVAQFSFDASSGQLTPSTPPNVATAAGAGPRHLEFSATLPVVYVMDENDSTVTTFSVSAGKLQVVSAISTLPNGFVGINTGADLHLSKDGKFLYGSNRGDNSIVIFAVDGATGALSLVGHQPTGGNTPRNFGLDPAGTILLAANQDSGNVVTFRIDTSTGKLQQLVTTMVSGKPNWVGVIPQPTK